MSKTFLEIAISQIGVKEITGTGHNQTIVKYAHESGFEWINDDETPWCSVFINWCAIKAGLSRSNGANARSWNDVGIQTDNPEPGDVVVFWRESPTSWKGHVGVFIGFNKNGTRVFCLGGNQGNQVSISAYSSNQVIGFRRLKATESFSLPEPILRKGDTGNEVKLLQDGLKIAGFNCGTSDGIFGSLTEGALSKFQEEKNIDQNGIYDETTQIKLQAVLQS